MDPLTDRISRRARIDTAQAELDQAHMEQSTADGRVMRAEAELQDAQKAAARAVERLARAQTGLRDVINHAPQVDFQSAITAMQANTGDTVQRDEAAQRGAEAARRYLGLEADADEQPDSERAAGVAEAVD